MKMYRVQGGGMSQVRFTIEENGNTYYGREDKWQSLGLILVCESNIDGLGFTYWGGIWTAAAHEKETPGEM